MASGSMLGRVIRNSRVATNLTQSVDPVSGTTSTSRPSWANQPSFWATANCEPTPAVSVRAHVPTRIRVWAGAVSGDASRNASSMIGTAMKGRGRRFMAAL